ILGRRFVKQAVLGRGRNEREQHFLQARIVPGDKHRIRAPRILANDVENGLRACESEALVPPRLGAGQRRTKRLAHSLGGTGEQQVPFEAMLDYVPADQPRALAPAGVEAAIEVALAHVVPIRLRVAQQSQTLHDGWRSSDSRAASAPETPAATRCKASASVSLMTGVPAGKAPRSRLGKAEESTTKWPASSFERIRRPNACASRARMMRSS